MADDDLELWDLEAAVLTGALHTRHRDDPRGTRYVIHGWSVERETQVGARKADAYPLRRLVCRSTYSLSARLMCV